MKHRITLFLLLGLYGFVFSQDQATYEAWQDSIKNPDYIMKNILYLDEMEVVENQYKSSNPLLTQVRKDKLMGTDELLHCLPGVNMMRRGNFASEPILRGLSSERYVVSIDGMRLFGACTDKMDPASSYIEPNNLANLDINLGNDDAMDGASTGGCVSFNLKTPKFNANKAVFVRIGMKYNSVSRGFDQLADLNINKKNLAVRSSFVHRKAQNYIAGGGSEIKYSQFEKYNYSFAMSYRLPQSQMLSFSFLGDDANDVGYPALPMDVSYAKAKMFSLSYYRMNLGKLKEVEIKAYHNIVDHAMDDTKRDAVDVPMHMDMPGNTHTSGLFAQTYLFDSLKTKIEYYNTFAHAEMTMYPDVGSPMFMLTYPDVVRNSTSISLDYNRAFLKQNLLKMGFRYEKAATYISSEFGEQQLNVFNMSGKKPKKMNLLNANISISRNIKKSFKLKLTTSYGQRLPTTSEQFGFYLYNRQNGYDYIGNPDIKKEGAWQNQLMAVWHKKKLRTNIAVFHYQFQDYIMGVLVPNYSNMTIGAKGVMFYENTKKASLMGGEWSLMGDITKTTHLMSTATYSYGYDFENDPLPLIPPLKITNSISQKWKGFIFQPELIWSNMQNNTSVKFDELNTDSFLLLNFRMHKTFKLNIGEMDVSTGVENILDKNYREHFDWGNIPRSGRNLFLNLSWRIK
ncbi:MAG: TonB-dependent receptor [Cyclobacteriaceae bacterium]|nr:TonB-dependent receptor [Cyclobacteriaceae bacterium]